MSEYLQGELTPASGRELTPASVSVSVSSLFSNTTGGDRHRETQLQLQRKLHEREHVSRQKKKLQQMKEDNAAKQRQERQTPLLTSPSGQQVHAYTLSFSHTWHVCMIYNL